MPIYCNIFIEQRLLFLLIYFSVLVVDACVKISIASRNKAPRVHHTAVGLADTPGEQTFCMWYTPRKTSNGCVSNPRHPRLWSHTKLHLCWNGKQCKQESVFGTACMHPHTQEELELWEYQKQHKCESVIVCTKTDTCRLILILTYWCVYVPPALQ